VHLLVIYSQIVTRELEIIAELKCCSIPQHALQILPARPTLDQPLLVLQGVLHARFIFLFCDMPILQLGTPDQIISLSYNQATLLELHLRRAVTRASVADRILDDAAVNALFSAFHDHLKRKVMEIL
jgi:hypothetical protein